MSWENRFHHWPSSLDVGDWVLGLWGQQDNINHFKMFKWLCFDYGKIKKIKSHSINARFQEIGLLRQMVENRKSWDNDTCCDRFAPCADVSVWISLCTSAKEWWVQSLLSYLYRIVWMEAVFFACYELLFWKKSWNTDRLNVQSTHTVKKKIKK